MSHLELRESDSFATRTYLPNLSKNNIVGRDGTCIDAARPFQGITVCPMEDNPMWYNR
jgi:hypothetical protein